MKKVINNQSGYIALIAIIIIVAVTLAIGLSLNILSIGETREGLLKQQSAQSFGLSDTCLQEAYLRLKRDASYAGGSLNLGQGSCIITIITSGADKIITSTSTVSNITRKVESSVRPTGGSLQINYWKELTN